MDVILNWQSLRTGSKRKGWKEKLIEKELVNTSKLQIPFPDKKEVGEFLDKLAKNGSLDYFDIS